MITVQPLVLLAIPLYVIGAVVWHVRRRPPVVRHLLHGAFFFYLVALVGVTFFPIPIDRDLIAFGVWESMGISRYNLVPLRGVFQAWQSSPYVLLSARHLVGNAVLLAPLGFLGPLLFRGISTTGRAAGLGFAVSLAIELTQVGVSLVLGYSRSFDVDDLILNTLGAVAGYSFYRLISQIPLIWRQRR